MRLVLPEGDGWSGTIVRGVDGDARPIWSLIVKRAFRRAGTAFEPDAEGEGLVVADETRSHGAGEPDEIEIQVTRESDLAPFKGRTDVAVLGFLDGDRDTDGRVVLGGSDWLTRTGALIPGGDRDADEHLFGFEPRVDGPREIEAGLWPGDEPTPTLPIPFPAGWRADFLRFQRRSAGFSGVAQATLPAAARVDVHRTADASDTPWSASYALAPLRARHFTWCGHGPDRVARWCGEDIAAPAPDTLILAPESDTASVLWRAVWPLADHPVERYRRLDVTEAA